MSDCHAVFGMPPENKIVWVTFKGNEAFLDADLQYADGDSGNVITFDKETCFAWNCIPTESW
jgi:hypothetical protein